MATKPDLARRVADLERQLADVLRSINQIPARHARVVSPPQKRFAKTCKPADDGDYPDAPCHLFDIKFLSVHNDAGTLSGSPRTEEPQVKAFIVLGHWLPEGTVIEVRFSGGQWWSMDRSQIGPIVYFHLTADLAPSDSEASIAINTTIGGDDPDLSEAHNLDELFSGSNGDKGFAAYDPIANRLTIINLECSNE